MKLYSTILKSCEDENVIEKSRFITNIILRAHLAHAGYPLIGDAKYGDRDFNLQMKECYGLTTQLLHANRLAFVNMSPPLGYLDGMEIKANPSRSFQNIKKDIFG